MSLLIDLDRLDGGGPAIAAVRRQPGGALQFPRGRSWRARRLVAARLCAALRGRARHRPDRRAGAAAVLSPPARLHLQSAVGLFLLSRRAANWRSMIYEVRNTFGDIHAYVLPVKPGEVSEPASGSSRTSCSTSRPSSRWRCAIISACSPPGERVKLRILETDREGPLLAATFNGRRRALTTSSAAAIVLRAAAGHLQDRRGDPLGGAAALAQGRAAGAADGRSGRDTGLASGEEQRLYWAGVVRPRPRREARVDQPCQVRSRPPFDGSAHARVDFGHPGKCRRDVSGICPAWSGWRSASAQSCNAARST